MNGQVNQSNIIIKEFKKFDGLVFDLDGTLVSLGVDWLELKNHLNEFCREKYRDTPIDFSSITDGIHKVRSNLGSQAYREILEIIAGHETNESKYIPNYEMIDYINSTDKKIAIYSMNTKKCVENFVKSYFKSKPVVVIAQDNSTEPKPTKLDLLKIVDSMELPKDKIIFIGDSQADLESGRLAGIFTQLIDFKF